MVNSRPCFQTTVSGNFCRNFLPTKFWSPDHFSPTPTRVWYLFRPCFLLGFLSKHSRLFSGLCVWDWFLPGTWLGLGTFSLASNKTAARITLWKEQDKLKDYDWLTDWAGLLSRPCSRGGQSTLLTTALSFLLQHKTDQHDWTRQRRKGTRKGGRHNFHKKISQNDPLLHIIT